MSRTNPYKKKRRSANKTVLIFGEGLHEELFLKYLQKLYSRNSGVAITIRNGKGGSAVDIVANASRELGDFDRRIVVLDNDKDPNEMNHARTMAKQKGIELLENFPCLEATLLSILSDACSFASKTSVWCKNEFESRYLNKQKRMDVREYERVFPKVLLDKRRMRIAELNQLISLMEGQRRTGTVNLRKI